MTPDHDVLDKLTRVGKMSSSFVRQRRSHFVYMCQNRRTSVSAISVKLHASSHLVAACFSFSFKKQLWMACTHLVFFLLTNPTSCGLHSHPKTRPAVARDAVQHSTRASSPMAYASPVIPQSSDPVFQPPAILSARFAECFQSIVEHSSGMKSNVCDSVIDRINPVALLSQDLRQHNCLFFPRCTTSRGKSFCDNFPRRSRLSLGQHCVAKL